MLGRALVDTVYPKTCAGCGMRGMWLCDLCEEETLVRHRIKLLHDKIAGVITARGAKLDPYSAAHLEEVKTRIEKTLDAIYTAR